MTTIIWTKGKLTADSARTRGGYTVNADVTKVMIPGEGEEWKIMGNKVIAFGRAGDVGAEHFLKEAMSSKEGLTFRTDLKVPFKMSFTAIIVDEFHNGWTVNGVYKQGPNTHDRLTVTSCQTPWTVGSGGIYAEAGLRAGLSAKKAMKIAKEMDPHTGGKTQVWKLPKPVKN